MVAGGALIDGPAAVLEGLAARNVQVWLVQAEAPDSPLHGGMMRHIRSVALAPGHRPAQAIKRLDLVAAFFRLFGRPARFRHSGRGSVRAMPRALIQGRREHA